MSGIVLGRYLVKESYAATAQQEEMDDPRINKYGDIEYECQYNIVRQNDKYLVTDGIFTCASYDTLEELMSESGLERTDVDWVRNP